MTENTNAPAEQKPAKTASKAKADLPKTVVETKLPDGSILRNAVGRNA